MLVLVVAFVAICYLSTTKAGRAESAKRLAKHNDLMFAIAIFLWTMLLFSP